ncbi:MAG: DUF1566 domain-containing protein [Betaproteobacteria bacterium]
MIRPIHGVTTMIRFSRSLAPALLFATVAAQAAGLPDTGQDVCFSGDAADVLAPTNPGSVSADAGTYPRQDCRFGRDPAAAAAKLAKVGAGAKGFDYTKIANNGSVLAANAPLGEAAGDWACTLDNVTGLTWEIKSAAPASLRFSGHSYTWYDTTTTTNGGFEGFLGSNSCGGTLPGPLCNTRAFAAAVNGGALCSYTDWRLPTLRELLTLVYADGTIPTIEQEFFPTAPAAPFWTAAPHASDASNAWVADFADGSTNALDKSRMNSVRLVRGGPF